MTISVEIAITDERLNAIERKLDLIMNNAEKLLAALEKIDATTTTIAGNVAGVATSLTTISTEIDSLQAALAAAGVPDALVSQAEAISAKVQTASDALAADVPTLQEIASKATLPTLTPVQPIVASS